MNYAVIKIQGHQEIVTAETQNLLVDKLEAQIGDLIKPEVLLISVDGKVEIGTPTVDFPIELQVIQHKKGEKLYIRKFHAKARYRRKTGFRAQQTVLKVTKFGEKLRTKLEVEKITKTKKTIKKKIVRETQKKPKIKAI